MKKRTEHKLIVSNEKKETTDKSYEKIQENVRTYKARQ